MLYRQTVDASKKMKQRKEKPNQKMKRRSRQGVVKHFASFIKSNSEKSAESTVTKALTTLKTARKGWLFKDG